MRMIHFAIHRAELFGSFLFIAGWLLPVILGFTTVRADADRRGQPGWLWALLTIPFGWLTILIYVAIRAATSGARSA
ncbi:MAG TPA: hypothetical protein VFQ25_04530 [Ktedonobacterales bacterium]|nr:hypothetical protein [Ktedonobacterales bacterium]